MQNSACLLHLLLDFLQGCLLQSIVILQLCIALFQLPKKLPIGLLQRAPVQAAEILISMDR
jgi:hypothetical protein